MYDTTGFHRERESEKTSPLKFCVLFAQAFCRCGPHKVVHVHARSRGEAAAERGERPFRVETGRTLQPVLQPPLQVCNSSVTSALENIRHL